tara:strand:+ start:1216 stop:2199 length:984 start_codon:yes stop_codon:yes gene_type:complete
MNKEKWNEICFLLSENIQTDISENSFEQNVVQALRVLDWKEYSGDIEIRPSFQIGAANRITPDFLIKSDQKKNLFVIEIKQPNIPLNTKFQQQLFSYMRQLKLEYGILIGQGIQIFYDGILARQEDPILLETIKITRNSDKGLSFVDLFSKGSFNEESLKSFTLDALKKIDHSEDKINLTNKILSNSYKERITELIKQDFLNEYDGELIKSVLDQLKFEIKEKNSEIVYPETKSTNLNYRNEHYSNEILPIQLNPVSEREFKEKLLLTKTAYITTYYKDGNIKKKVWNVNSFNESSNLLGNIRSRLDFRNGNWQKLKIEKVLVSIYN